jgi:hypothetical protein
MARRRRAPFYFHIVYAIAKGMGCRLAPAVDTIYSQLHMATAKKKLQSLEDQMRALALAIDSSYARTGFSPDNIRLNREFDALEALYNSTSTTTMITDTQQQRIIIQRTASTHAHLFSISRKNLIRARAARSSYFASTTAASSFIGSPIQQLRGGGPKKQKQQQRPTTTSAQSARTLLLQPPQHNNNKNKSATTTRFLGD